MFLLTYVSGFVPLYQFMCILVYKAKSFCSDILFTIALHITNHKHRTFILKVYLPQKLSCRSLMMTFLGYPITCNLLIRQSVTYTSRTSDEFTRVSIHSCNIHLRIPRWGKLSVLPQRYITIQKYEVSNSRHVSPFLTHRLDSHVSKRARKRSVDPVRL